MHIKKVVITWANQPGTNHLIYFLFIARIPREHFRFIYSFFLLFVMHLILHNKKTRAYLVSMYIYIYTYSGEKETAIATYSGEKSTLIQIILNQLYYHRLHLKSIIKPIRLFKRSLLLDVTGTLDL
jgi:hypothetical protein